MGASIFLNDSFCKFRRERSENVFGEVRFLLMVLAEQWQCSLYANVLSVQSSVPTMFLHFFLQTDGLQTDGSRLFRCTPVCRTRFQFLDSNDLSKDEK